VKTGWPGRTLLRWFLVWIVARGSCAIFFRLAHRWRRGGGAEIPAEGPLLFVANHQSFYDPPAVGSEVWHRAPAFLARRTLFRNPLFGGLIRFLNSIPLDQSGRGASAFRSAIAELEAGRTVLIFPEGSRSADGAMHAFNPGIMLLVRRAKPRVVPVGIDGAFDALPIGASRPRFGVPIATRVGEPIEAEELLSLSTAEALQLLQTRVEQLRLQCRAELRERTGGRWPSRGPGDVAWWDREPSPPAEGGEA
jgi:1-acyl-sn-glycerol-3-phosphate acyltransferase